MDDTVTQAFVDLAGAIFDAIFGPVDHDLPFGPGLLAFNGDYGIKVNDVGNPFDGKISTNLVDLFTGEPLPGWGGRDDLKNCGWVLFYIKEVGGFQVGFQPVPALTVADILVLDTMHIENEATPLNSAPVQLNISLQKFQNATMPATDLGADPFDDTILCIYGSESGLT